MMPMRLSIVSALPDVKIAGRIANPPARAIPGAASRAKAAERAGWAFARGGALTTSVATSLNFGSMLGLVFARSHKAGRPEDEYQHQQQVRNDRGNLRHGHVPHIEQQPAAWRRHPDTSQHVGNG